MRSVTPGAGDRPGRLCDDRPADRLREGGAGRLPTALLGLLLLPVFASGAGGCRWLSSGDSDRPAVKAVYDKKSGRLELLTYDTNKDGKADVWSHMDGTRLLSMEIDKDYDGVIDRWEYYTAKGGLEKVGFSRVNDGRVDSWAFQGADGQVARVEVSTRRNGTVNRWEHYEQGTLVRAQEDGNGDGRIEKWEEYRAGSLASVAMDTDGNGRADRRLIYGPDGVKVEKLPK